MGFILIRKSKQSQKWPYRVQKPFGSRAPESLLKRFLTLHMRAPAIPGTSSIKFKNESMFFVNLIVFNFIFKPFPKEVEPQIDIDS